MGPGRLGRRELGADARSGPWSLRKTRGRRRGGRPGLLGPLDSPASAHLPGYPPPPATPVPRISPSFPDLPGPSPFSRLPPSPALSRSPGLPAHLSPSLCGSPALPAPGALARAEAAGCVRGEAEWPSLTPGELCGAWSAVGPGRRALAGGRSPEGTVRVGPTWALPAPARPGREEAREAPAAPPLGGGRDWGEEARAARTPGAGGSAVAGGRGSVLPRARSGADLWLRKAQGPPVGFPPSFRLPHLVWVP